jgi:hypothetical protein
MDNILLYYWDNEILYDTWDVPAAGVRAVREADVDEEGNPLHPIYALQGNEGLARKYNNEVSHMTDIHS